jgi:hypothetical protein
MSISFKILAVALLALQAAASRDLQCPKGQCDCIEATGKHECAKFCC